MTPGWGAGGLFLLAGLVWLAGMRVPVRAGVVLLVALLVRAPFFFCGVHSDDVYRYVWEGRVQQEGHSPYATTPDDPALAHLRRPTHWRINHPDLPAIYPPLAQAVFLGATAAGLEQTGVANLFRLLDVAVVLLLFLWLRSRWVMIYAWCPLAVAGPAGGHLDPLMLLFLVGCAWAWESRRFRSAGLLLGGAILAKTVAVVLLPWILIRRPKAAVIALAVAAAGHAPYGFDPGSLLTFAAEFSFNASLFRLIGVLCAPLLVLWVVFVTLSQPRIASAGALLMAGLLVCSPTVHFWYLSWFLVFLPAVGPRRWTEPLLLWCVTVTATYPTYARTPPFVEHYALTALEYVFPALLALWLLWRRWPRRVPASEPRTSAPPPREFGVVIPCRGEAENLRRLLPRWSSADRVVVADTPCGDGTEALCAAMPNVEYLAVNAPGYGAAVRAGLDALQDLEFVIVCDADHLRGPEQAGALLAPFDDPRVGLVTAARTNRLPAAQRLGNGLATLLIALGWGHRFVDLGPFRALRMPCPVLEDRGFGFNVEMNVRALEQGMTVAEVALPGSERQHGRDRISGTWRGVLGAGVGILRQIYQLREQSCRQPS